MLNFVFLAGLPDLEFYPKILVIFKAYGDFLGI